MARESIRYDDKLQESRWKWSAGPCTHLQKIATQAMTVKLIFRRSGVRSDLGFPESVVQFVILAISNYGQICRLFPSIQRHTSKSPYNLAPIAHHPPSVLMPNFYKSFQSGKMRQKIPSHISVRNRGNPFLPHLWELTP